MTRTAAPFLILAVLAAVPAFSPAEDGFRRALPGYQFEFPRDHGSHPDFRTEWWYFTGNVATAEGRRFGYKLTFFRTALAPPDTTGTRSPLAADQLFIAHFALSDFESRSHRTWDRIGRPGLGQGEASTERLDVRLNDWTLVMDDDGAMHLRAQADGGGIDMVMRPAKPFVIHGRDGAHQKAAAEGQASHYISFTRLNAEGTITWAGERHAVSGLAWKDHEFGSDQLGEEEVGWDWFALQLDTGEDLMVYQLRRRDGTANNYSSGSLVAPDGTRRELPGSSYRIRHTSTWKSPRSGGVYPMGWEIDLPEFDAKLRVIPVFEDQEMDTRRTTGTVYWEGAITVEGTWRGRPVGGRGYVELVGYADEFNLL